MYIRRERSVVSLSHVAIVLTFLYPFLSLSMINAWPNTQVKLGQKLEAYLDLVAKERGLNAAVLVARGNKIVLRKAYGTADDASLTPFTVDTVVGIASVSKQFTAAAILRLVDQGKISVNDTLSKLLPGVPPDKAQITLHQLLTHMSGLVSDYMDSDLEPLTKQDALNRIFASKLQSKPSEQYSYSNAGYTLLAAIVETVSGQEHDTFLRTQFFDPLGMKNTGNWAEPRFALLPVSAGYMNGVSSGPINKIVGPYWTVKGNGGIISTIDDMFVWYRALRDNKVLSADSTKAMFTSYTTSNGTDIDYGYGWEISESKELGRLITHNGGGLTGNSIVSDYIEQNLTVIMLGNRITYQTLNGIPLVISLPADETSRAIILSVRNDDFSHLPTATFVLWPYLILGLSVLCGMGVAFYWWRRRRNKMKSGV